MVGRKKHSVSRKKIQKIMGRSGEAERPKTARILRSVASSMNNIIVLYLRRCIQREGLRSVENKSSFEGLIPIEPMVFRQDRSRKRGRGSP